MIRTACGAVRPARRRVAAVVVSLTLAAAVLARGTELTSADAAGRATGAAATKTVTISGFAYEPRVLRVRKGEKVRFVNSSSMTHTATDPGAFDTGDIRPGRSAVIRLPSRGTFRYHCRIHPFMRGRIIVR